MTFRVLPEPSELLKYVLACEGQDQEAFLASYPYDEARSRGRTGSPDPRRFRDLRDIGQVAGLLYEDSAGVIRLTELGRTTLRWLSFINEKNALPLARHAAYALSACQLVNPTGAGRGYPAGVVVFPYSFIWRAMLAPGLEHQISSDELDRAVFSVQNEADLASGISRIQAYRRSGNIDDLGPPTISGTAVNDRIIHWVSVASFGFTFIADKKEGGVGNIYYKIRPRMVDILESAIQVRHRHRSFSSVEEYVEYISAAAALPRDLR